MKTIIEFEIFQRPATGEYFQGRVREWKGVFTVSCLAASGGNKKFNVLDLINYKNKDRVILIRKIRAFARRHKFIFKYLKQ